MKNKSENVEWAADSKLQQHKRLKHLVSDNLCVTIAKLPRSKHSD